MVHLYRLILAVLALFASAGAMALQPITVPAWSLDGINFFTSKSAACSSVNTANQWTGATASFVSVSGLLCRYGVTFPGNPIEYQHLQLIVGSKSTCPANAIETAPGACACATNYIEENGQCKPKPSCPVGQHEEGGACVPNNCKPNETRVNGICIPEPPCPAGQVRVNGKCKEETCPKRGTFAGEYLMSSKAPTAMCEGGCTVSITTFLTAYQNGKAVETVGMGYYTGSSCTPPSSNDGEGGTGGDGDGDGDGGDGDGDGGNGGDGDGGEGDGGSGGDGPEKCPNGDCTGTGGQGTGGEEPGTDGKCPPGTYMSGGKCYPNDRPNQPPDNDGKCPPGFAKVGDTCVPYKPDEDDEDDKPSTFGGACGGFTCEGDAIQCAIAREQHVRACKLFDDESAESKLYNDNKGKEGKQTNDLPGNETVSLLGRINMNDLFGAGAQCTRDVTVVVMGQSVTLPFTKICPAIAVIGNIMVAVSLLLAARILTRG